MKTYKMICGKCGSEDVTTDALATWDVGGQRWEVSNPLDNGDCNTCGASGNCIDQVEVVTLTVTRSTANIISRALHEAAACRSEEVTDGGHDAEQTAMNEETAEDYLKAAETFDAAITT